jgi:hypothetical protein
MRFFERILMNNFVMIYLIFLKSTRSPIKSFLFLKFSLYLLVFVYCLIKNILSFFEKNFSELLKFIIEN